VAGELRRRFGLPYWQFALTATDANRFVLRIARQIQRRPKVLVFNWCYHGSVDETVAVIGEDGETAPKPGNVGPQVDPRETTVVVEFNDLDGVRRALARGDVACVLTEPALTNIGIVLPAPGFLEGLEMPAARRDAARLRRDAHDLGRSRRLRPGLGPDAGHPHDRQVAGAGVPVAAYGVSQAVLDRIEADDEGDYLDWGGVGGTLAATRSRWRHACDARRSAHRRGVRRHDRARDALPRGRAGGHRPAWRALVHRAAGARAEYHFYPEPPAAAARPRP